jgi:hypothetical protein
MRTRQILLALGFLGLFFACAGVSALFLSPRDFSLGRWLLIISSLILTPLFGFVISMRGSARRSARRRAIDRKQELDAQLAQMVTPEAIRATADLPDPASPAASHPTEGVTKEE